MKKGDSRYPYALLVRMSAEQAAKLEQLSAKSCLPRAECLRQLLDGYVPQERPPLDFEKVLSQLRRMGVNLNQIARRANATGHIDSRQIQKFAEEFEPLATVLLEYAYLPAKIQESSSAQELHYYLSVMKEW